jgi:two-component system cell cycle sensor histidine kinase/response regulator CckA
MNDQLANSQPRILIVDDNTAIHEDFRKILGAQGAGDSHFNEMAKVLFGTPASPVARTAFRIDSAFQGREALELAQRALQENDPYLLAFVDVRMPPGWDGVETLERIWQCYPELQAVICTAYSDYSWDDITRRLGHTDNLVILKKPFEPVEVLQLAHALAKKWTLARQAQLRMDDLDRMVRERTQELVAANQKLQQEMDERTRIQKALRISEERFSKAFAASPMPMAIQSQPEGRFLDANSSFLELTGYTADQLLQRTSDELRLWENGAATAIQPEGRIRNRPCVLQRRDAATRSTVLWAEPIALASGPCLLVIVEDVSDQQKLESQLRQAQKMEAVGRLAAGIAHEFNNILTVIQGHAGLLHNSLANTPSAESAVRIVQASERAASLTGRLLAFSRKQPLQLKPINLSVLVQGLRKMLSQLIGERYALQFDCAASLPSIHADEGNIEQILINLTLNARDAMPSGGTIRFGTSHVLLDDPTAGQNSEAHAGRFVCLTVVDAGCGMTPEVLSRIFDPFFTTKDVGKGTGLGLSTIHGIVQQHHGWIEVNSQVGHGSTFKVFFSASEETPTLAAASEGAADSTLRCGSGEAILVVEDEASVRELAHAVLQRGGYRVFEAADGHQALAVWEQCPARIDLLVTDLVMPNGVSGGALAKMLQAKDARLKTLYTSGYSSEIIKGDLPLTQGVNFLRKPYDPASLLKAVKQCLDGDAHAQKEALSNEGKSVKR